MKKKTRNSFTNTWQNLKANLKKKFSLKYIQTFIKDIKINNDVRLFYDFLPRESIRPCGSYFYSRNNSKSGLTRPL